MAIGYWLLAIGRASVSVSVKCGVLDTLSGEDEISQVLIKSLNPLSSLILVLEISDSEAWVGWRGGASEAGIDIKPGSRPSIAQVARGSNF